MNADKTITLRHHRCPGDLDRIVTLHAELYAREYGFGLQFEMYAAETLAEFGRPERTERDRLWVAEIEGRIAGSIGIIGREGNAAQLRCLLIAPDVRGMGLGRRLVETALAFCREVGYDSIFLWTVQDLSAAARLYAAAGFVKTDELPPSDWGVPVIEERYELRLSAAHEEVSPSSGAAAYAIGASPGRSRVIRPGGQRGGDRCTDADDANRDHHPTRTASTDVALLRR